MSLRHGTALAWAERYPDSLAVRLGILEAYAVQRHPEALQHMGDDGRAIARSAGARSSSRAPMLLLIPVLLALAAPVVGLAAILGDPGGFHRMDASASVPIAGVSFALAAVVQVGAAIAWWRSGRARHYLVLILALGTAACAAATWLLMQNASALDGFGDWAPWRVPVAIAGLLGLAFGIAQLALGRARPAAPPIVVDEGEQQALRAEIDAIPADEREAILLDRNAAIAHFADRGRIAGDVAQRAMRAELGTLHRIDAELQANER